MLYPVTSRRVRTNAYFLPAFDGLRGSWTQSAERVETPAGSGGGNVPLTSNAIKGDITFKRDMQKLKELQSLLKETKKQYEKAKKIRPFQHPSQVGFSADNLSPQVRSAMSARQRASLGRPYSIDGILYKEIERLEPLVREAKRKAQESANTAIERQLIMQPYKTHIIKARFVPSKDVVVYDVTKDGEMIQEGVSDVAGAKTVIDKEIVKRQEAALKKAEEERIAAQREADQQGPPTATTEDVATDLTSQEQGQTRQGPGTTAPSNGEKKKNNLPLILGGAAAAGVAALVLMK